jgi:CRISPR-associated endonuclease/helicase Cas3
MLGQKWAVGRKLFFCYPTTGTASQGYLDYAAETEIESRLMHSRAAIDLAEILVSHEDDDSEEIESRLEAFAAWQAKLIVCTVDTVLGLMQNNRKPLFSFPAIAQGAFVFDEIHSFDQQLFGALLRFLKSFRGAPILLMSASLSKEQEQAICEIVNDLGEEVNIIDGEQKLEIIPRYRMEYISEVANFESLDEVWEVVLQTLKSKGKNQKVLWVTNTVKDCVNRYKQAEDKFKTLSKDHVKLRIYHSRYRYKDRLNRHKEVIEAFKSSDPCLVITTQVCEMSLDLSADLLVSAIAPATSLIQRMGRLNRRVFEDDSGNMQLTSGQICPAIFYPWEQSKPYEKEDLATGLELIKQLQANPEISQQDLARVTASLSASVPESVRSGWLDDNWCTYPIPLRKGGYTMTVLLEKDMPDIDRAAAERKKTSKMTFPQAKIHEAQRWTVPVRLMDCRYEWKRFKFYYRVPDECIDYSEFTGAEEKCK